MWRHKQWSTLIADFESVQDFLESGDFFLDLIIGIYIGGFFAPALGQEKGNPVRTHAFAAQIVDRCGATLELPGNVQSECIGQCDEQGEGDEDGREAKTEPTEKR
nr:hypothetical protein [Tepidiphilus margaritifer]